MFGKLRAALRMGTVSLSIICFLGGYYISSPLLGRNQKRGFRLRRNWCKFVMFAMGIKCEMTGNPIPDEKPILYVCNHRSFTDPIIVCKYIEAFAISKAEVSKYPLISTGAEETGVIYVQRDNRKSRSATREAIEKSMEVGKNILIYPEGTTGEQEFTKAFKRGSFDVAAAGGFAVVPVTLEYRDKEKDYWFQRGLKTQMYRQYSKARTYTKIHFGEPIKSDDGQELVEMAEASMKEQIGRMHREWQE